MSIYHMFNIKIAEKLGMVEAVLLDNIERTINKHSANGENFHKGKYWIYDSSKSFAEIFTYLSRQQISRALKRLDRKSVV